MKRLYVRPDFRGRKIGERLVRELIGFSRGAGYRRLQLDTLPSMQSAQDLYEHLGFKDIPAYYPNRLKRPLHGA